ncbi:hypothetical protein V1511DRAFT_458254 [Dipodascopsis uninucleata]
MLDNSPIERSPIPAPQPVGKPTFHLQSILEQFDPLTLHASTQQRPPLSSRSSTSSVSSRISRTSSSASNRVRLNRKPVPSAESFSDSASSSPIRTEEIPVSETSDSVAKASSEANNTRDKSIKHKNKAKKSLQEDLPKPEDQPAELPFDFQRFLEQLRHKGADPLARYLKSFLHEFGKRSWTVREQVKIVQDFQSFIAPRLSQYPPFATLPDSEVANALEGMEKLIMNRLYVQTFSPEITPARRTFSHEEDLLRDNILDEKMHIWSWIEGQHLDIDRSILDSGERFVGLAKDELLKINNYRAPRDKVICILNCCKVIFGLLRQTHTEESADKFLPILIYVVIKAQPQNLFSNVQYIMRFRNPDKLNGEAGYYLSSLQGAMSFIETLDRTSLNITNEEFEERVEQSVKLIQERTRALKDQNARLERERTVAAITTSGVRTSTPTRNLTPSAAAVTSQVQALSATFVAPFKQIQKLFDGDDSEDDNESALSRSHSRRSRNSFGGRSLSQSVSQNGATQERRNDGEHTSSETRDSRQGQKSERLEYNHVVEALYQMFPTLGVDVIEDVVTEKRGRVGKAVDACLALVDGSNTDAGTVNTKDANNTEETEPVEQILEESSASGESPCESEPLPPNGLETAKDRSSVASIVPESTQSADVIASNSMPDH